MLVLTKLKHPAWSGVFSLILAAGATLPPNLTDLLRGALLIAAVLAATRTFYMTEYGGRSVKRTVVFGLGCAILAIAVFAGIHVFDAKVKIAPPVQASGEEQQ